LAVIDGTVGASVKVGGVSVAVASKTTGMFVEVFTGSAVSVANGAEVDVLDGTAGRMGLLTPRKKKIPAPAAITTTGTIAMNGLKRFL
jgi:hypothetical protein